MLQQSPSKPPRLKLTLGILLSICWPFILGNGLTHDEGPLGMLLGLAMIGLMTWLVLMRWPDRYAILANGLVTLGLISLIPILPFILGGLVMTLHGAGIPRKSMQMGFTTSLAVTLTYAICYLFFALIAGCFVRDIRRMWQPTDTTNR